MEGQEPRGGTRESFRGPESKGRPLGREERQKGVRRRADRLAGKGREGGERPKGVSVEEWGIQAETQT